MLLGPQINYLPSKSHEIVLFTWSNQSVHGLGKWYAKMWTDEFCAGTAFTICANQLHLPKNDREGLKLFLKMALNKCNTNFRLEYSVRKNRTTFSDVPLLRWNDPKCHVHLLSKGIFRKRFVNSTRPFFCFLFENRWACGQYPPPPPPRYILSYARSTIPKEKIEGLWTS